MYMYATSSDISSTTSKPDEWRTKMDSIPTEKQAYYFLSSVYLPKTNTNAAKTVHLLLQNDDG